MTCPCGTLLDFDECCALVHQDLAQATTAESLMRARYTAFVVHNIDFIYNTIHPTTRRYYSRKELEKWAIESKWMQLEVIRSTVNTVEFKAHYMDLSLAVQVHHERSRFKQYQGKWYFLDGEVG